MLGIGSVDVFRFIEQFGESHQMGSDGWCFGHGSTLGRLGDIGNREGCTSPVHEETPGEKWAPGAFSG